jgi:hypothetical protein
VSGLPAFGAGGGSNIGQLAFADYDGDGDLDVFAFAISNGFSALVYANDGSGTSFTQAAALAGPATNVSGFPIQGAIGDIDCDGAVDVAVGGSVYLNDGGSFGAATVVDGAFISQLGDLDGDGFLDLVTNSVELGLRLYLGDGGMSWSEADVGLPDASLLPIAPPNYVLDDAWGLDLADIDGNGNVDIVRGFKAIDSMGFGTDTERKNYLEIWIR